MARRLCLFAAAALLLFAPVASAAPPLQLPFPRGESWEANGPHSYPGGPQPYDHVDLGRPGRQIGTVTAAGAGTFRWQACSSGGYQAWVNHGGGWETHYQHLSAISAGQGAQVAAGQAIGATGTQCGQTGGYPHVHFGVLLNGRGQSLHGLNIGGYTLRTTGGNYVGCWYRNSDGGQQVCSAANGDARCCLPNNQDGGLPGDGAFVSHVETGMVYRIAGGAPIYVSNWSAYGGPQPVTPVNSAQLAQYRAVPADGTFINSVQDGAVYRIAGGAPIYVSTWSTYGGPQPTVGIDKWAIDNITHPAAHLRAVPADGTFVNSAQDGAVYRIAGGAPIYVSTWSTYGGPQPTVGIDKWAIDNATHPAAHLRALPADGTFVHSMQNGAVYRIAGGAPIYVSTWSTFGGPQPTVGIDKWAIDNPTHPAAHLRRTIANHTFVRVANGSRRGLVTRAAGGGLLDLTACPPLGGCSGYVDVDEYGFDRYRERNPRPVDGTVLRGLPSKRLWLIRGGRRYDAASGPGAVAVNDATIAAIPPPDAAGPPAVTATTPEEPMAAAQPPAPAALAPSARLGLRAAPSASRQRLRRGLSVRVSGARPGSVVRVRLRRGSRTLARSSRRAGATGGVTLRLRVSRRAVRGLRRGTRLNLTVTAPGARSLTQRVRVT
jgi:murein DD-endopeptidase MepM/ murein hydrolase activator NlpD